jgi:ABC-type sugar transport system ATPase subunit
MRLEAASSTISDVPLVRLAGIEKSFGGAKVLKGVDLDLRAGEVHALVGENGAGKSTIGKIIGGYYVPDKGSLSIASAVPARWTPRIALQNGIAMIHQELQLVPQLTVAENVFLGIEENRLGITVGSDERRLRELDARCGFRLEPAAVVGTLSIADRQKVEIMRAIARNARVIIMDEPTSSLTVDEVQRLHGVIRWLRSEGRTIVYVTHQLDQVFSLCDRVTIMRDGQKIRTAQVAAETRASLVEAMLGGPSDIVIPARPARPSTNIRPILVVEDFSTATGLKDVSIIVRPGEIVGLIGLVGSGRTELARAIFGADRALSGTIRLDGKVYETPTPARSIARGMAFIPEDRRKQGLDLTQTVRPNISFVHTLLASRFGFIERRREYGLVDRMVKGFGIVPTNPDGQVASYSGGNQQKVLLSRWTCRQPRLILLDEPSRGVDIGARRRIHDHIVDLARQGVGVLLICSELDEVLGLAHRGYLMRTGSIIGEVECALTSEAEILSRLFDLSHEPGRTIPSNFPTSTSSAG